MMKSRSEIALIRLLAKCQEMANNSDDVSQEWRLPRFIDACEELMMKLSSDSSSAPTKDCMTEYQNKIKFLKSLLPPAAEDDCLHSDNGKDNLQTPVSMPLPQGNSLARDTVSKQIYQKLVEKQNMSSRDQLLGSSSSSSVRDPGSSSGVSLDKIINDQREQQERIAEEMILLTQSLKQQSSTAGDIIRRDTVRLETASNLADSNLEKLNVETKRVGEFSARGNCRCWIWLMMVLVVFTFIGMVLMMRLFSKKNIMPPASSTPVSSSSSDSVTETLSSRHVMDEL